MKKRYQFVVSVPAVIGLMFLFMACGSGGGGDVTYDGSTDPAVADSTNATVLAEYGMGSLEAGFPLADPFVIPPPGLMSRGLAAEPLVADFTTTVTIDVPSEAVYYGSDYDSKEGSGTADINGTMELFLGNNIAADANTWFIIEGELDGSIVFDDFSTGGGPALTGTVTVPYGVFEFSGDADFLMSTMEIAGDPGFPVWQELEMTFADLGVSDDGDSWSLGEGDWVMSITTGSSVDLEINSMTVEYDGQTYKVEDTSLSVGFGELEPDALSAPAVPTLIGIEYTDISISGIDYKAGTFFHPDLGEFQMAGNLREEDPPEDIVEGSLTFYNTMGATQYRIYFDYDESTNMYAPATYYNLEMVVSMYEERGYYIDGTFIPSDLAPIIPR